MNPVLLSPALILLGYLAYTRYPTAIILIAALLPTYLMRTNLFGLPTNFLELAIAVVAVAGLLQPSTRTRWCQAYRTTSPLVLSLIIAFLAASIISVIISPHLLTSLGILKGWIISPLLIAWLIYALPHPATNHPKILTALVLSGMAMSLIALTQIGSLSRVQGVYEVPNSLALFLAPLFMLAAWRRQYASAVVLILALVATQSAAAIIAVALSLLIGILLWAKPQQKMRLVVWLIVILFIATLYLASTGRLTYLARPWLSPSQPNSISVRLQLWSISQAIIAEHPFLGIGLGQFEPAYQQKLHERFSALAANQPSSFTTYYLPLTTYPLREFVFRDPHNWILSFWLNVGLLGLLSFIGLHLFVAKQLFPQSKNITTYYLLLTTYYPAALALLCLLTFGLADTIYWKNDLSALHLILLALLLSQVKRNRPQDYPS